MISASVPIKSRRILACRDTLAAGLAPQAAGMAPELPADVVGPAPLPAGVTVRAWSAPPAIVTPWRATSLELLHDDALRAAWQDGAWDLAVSLVPPLAGVELGLISAANDYSADPGLEDILLDAGERGRLVIWSWRPMRDGPESRRRRNGSEDRTLGPDLGRQGEPPAGLRRPNFAWRKHRDWLIRLGDDGTPRGPRPRPATINQRGYLGRLLRQAGQSDRLPARLTFDAAAAWIDRLKAGDAS